MTKDSKEVKNIEIVIYPALVNLIYKDDCAIKSQNITINTENYSSGKYFIKVKQY